MKDRFPHKNKLGLKKEGEHKFEIKPKEQIQKEKGILIQLNTEEMKLLQTIVSYTYDSFSEADTSGMSELQSEIVSENCIKLKSILNKLKK